MKIKCFFLGYDLKLLLYLLIGLFLYFAAKPASRNEYFHYTSGISVGIFGSLLILFIIAFKYTPKVRCCTPFKFYI
jgi:hypothetical protein